MSSSVLYQKISYSILYLTSPLSHVPPKIIRCTYIIYHLPTSRDKLGLKYVKYIFLGYSHTQNECVILMYFTNTLSLSMLLFLEHSFFYFIIVCYLLRCLPFIVEIVHIYHLNTSSKHFRNRLNDQRAPIIHMYIRVMKSLCFDDDKIIKG